MKKILILGANSYIGTSFHNYLTTKYPGQYQTDIVSLRGTDWKNRDWAGYDSVLNVTGKAHADISSLTEEQKKEYYAVNCDLAVEAARKAIADGVTQYIYFSSIIVYGDSSNSRKPVRITAEGDIAIIGPDTIALQGGMGGTYVKSLGKSGQGTLLLQSQTAGEIKIPFQVTV